MWMGGPVPLGYYLGDRRLVINEAEAAIVRRIFERYRQLRSMGDLVAELERDGVRTRRRVFKDGRTVGDIPFTKGPLVHLLANRLYTGEVEHKGKIYPGEHPAIIDLPLWEEVQAIIAANRVERKLGSKARAPSLLTGMVRDDHGRAMMPTHSVREARRYRYYATRAAAAGERGVEGRLRIPAAVIESLVVERLAAWLEATTPDPHDDALTIDTALAKARWQAGTLRDGLQAEKRAILLDLQVEVAIHAGSVSIAFTPPGDSPIHLDVPARLVDRGSDVRLTIGPNGSTAHTEPDPVLLRLVVLGFAAREHMVTGRADVLVEGYSRQHLTRLARLGYLAPDIVSSIVEGSQPAALSGRRLLRVANLPVEWAAQRRLLGFG